MNNDYLLMMEYVDCRPVFYILLLFSFYKIYSEFRITILVGLVRSLNLIIVLNIKTVRSLNLRQLDNTVTEATVDKRSQRNFKARKISKIVVTNNKLQTSYSLFGQWPQHNRSLYWLYCIEPLCSTSQTTSLHISKQLTNF